MRLHELQLRPGESLRVDTGCIVAMEEAVDYDIQMVPGIKTALFGGEGQFFAALRGPGRVLLDDRQRSLSGSDVRCQRATISLRRMVVSLEASFLTHVAACNAALKTIAKRNRRISRIRLSISQNARRQDSDNTPQAMTVSRSVGLFRMST